MHQVTTTCAHQELVQLHVFGCISERLMCAVATLNVCELAIHKPTLQLFITYRMAENFGGEFILADWRF